MLKSNSNCLFKYSKTILGVIAARRSLDRSERDFRQWMLICHISAGRGVVGVGVWQWQSGAEWGGADVGAKVRRQTGRSLTNRGKVVRRLGSP